MSFVPSRQAQKFYGVSGETLREWANKGKVEYKTTEGGHRRYKIFQPNEGARRICYARVSSSKQEGELDNQVKFLTTKYPNHEIITDIGSGLNNERKGFKTILESLFERNIEEVVVSSYDRFTRMGREFFEWLFVRFGGKITVVQEVEKSPNEELADDLMEIITVFSARYYGRRRYDVEKN